MIGRDHPGLSLSRQYRLLSLSRSSLYRAPQSQIDIKLPPTASNFPFNEDQDKISEQTI